MLFVFFIASTAFAQSNKQDIVAGQYQIPQTVYVGDKARLVYPLPQLLSIQKDAKVSMMQDTENQTEQTYPDGTSQIQSHPVNVEIVIKNMELDKDGKNLIIDFQAYRTGTVTLPVIMVGSEKFTGIQVQIASLIDSGNGSMALSPPALPLAAAGTFWLITTIVLCVIVVLVLIVFLWKKWGVFLIGFNTNLKSYYLLFTISGIIKKTKKNLSKEKITGLQTITILSSEIRKFFSLFWDIPCISMVPEEFLTIHIDNIDDLRIDICNFFKTCDSLRFSGEGITVESANKIIEDAKSVLQKVKENIS